MLQMWSPPCMYISTIEKDVGEGSPFLKSGSLKWALPLCCQPYKKANMFQDGWWVCVTDVVTSMYVHQHNRTYQIQIEYTFLQPNTHTKNTIAVKIPSLG